MVAPVDPVPIDLGLLAAWAAMFHAGLGIRSMWALETAVRAAQCEGIPCRLVIIFSGRVKDRAELTFSTEPESE